MGSQVVDIIPFYLEDNILYFLNVEGVQLNYNKLGNYFINPVADLVSKFAKNVFLQSYKLVWLAQGYIK